MFYNPYTIGLMFSEVPLFQKTVLSWYLFFTKKTRVKIYAATHWKMINKEDGDIQSR